MAAMLIALGITYLLLQCLLLHFHTIERATDLWLGARLPGRLGNHLFAFAGAYGIAKSNNLSLCILEGDISLLAHAFVGPFAPPCPDGVSFTEVPPSHRFVPAADVTHLLRPHSWCAEEWGVRQLTTHTALASLLQTHAHFRGVSSTLRQLLRFRPHLMRAADKYLADAGKQCAAAALPSGAHVEARAPPSSMTFIGVHVRLTEPAISATARGAKCARPSHRQNSSLSSLRGLVGVAIESDPNSERVADTVACAMRAAAAEAAAREHESDAPGGDYHLAPAAYYERAIAHFRRRHGGQACFIVVGQARDLAWVREQAIFAGSDVVVMPTSERREHLQQPRTPSEDLALLARCQHTIISVGTFGWWAAFLAGGDATYFLPDRGLRPR